MHTSLNIHYVCASEKFMNAVFQSPAGPMGVRRLCPREATQSHNLPAAVSGQNTILYN